MFEPKVYRTAEGVEIVSNPVLSIDGVDLSAIMREVITSPDGSVRVRTRGFSGESGETIKRHLKGLEKAIQIQQK